MNENSNKRKFSFFFAFSPAVIHIDFTITSLRLQSFPDFFRIR